jgi:hypothetical protein
MIAAALFFAAQASAHAPDLSPFSPFVGACWRSDFTAKMHDTHCFERIYGGAHVRDRHEVEDDGKVIYAGETTYSADGSSLVFTYVNSLGGVGVGKVAPGKSILGFKGSMRASPDKAQQPIDSEWRLIDADHYEVRSLVRPTDGKAQKPLIFTRVAANPQK